MVDGSNVSKAEAEAEAEAPGRAGEAQLFEMKALALRSAFALRHSPAGLSDPQAYDEASRELAQVLEARVAAFEERAAQLAAREPKTFDDQGRQITVVPFHVGAPTPESLARDRQDREIKGLSDRLQAQEQEALARMCVASGVWGRIVEPDLREAFAKACGLQESQLELGLSESTLENLKDRYSVEAVAGPDGQFRFECSSKPDHEARGLVRKLPTQDGGVLGWLDEAKHPVAMMTPASLSSPAWDAMGPFEGRMDPSAWAKERAWALPEGASRLHRLAWLAGGFVKGEGSASADLFSLDVDDPQIVAGGLVEARRVLERARAGLRPEQAALDMATRPWSARSRQVEDFRGCFVSLVARSRNVKDSDKVERACRWYDSVAGERASELVGKVLGVGPASDVAFKKLEEIASNSGALWAAMEGQEALGLFSIRAAGLLGLQITGRDLPGRTKAVLEESHGVGPAGWRLLGKMDPGGGGPGQGGSIVKDWLDNLSHRAKVKAEDAASAAAAAWPVYDGIENMVLDFSAAGSVLAKDVESGQRVFFGVLDACGRKGLDPDAAQTILNFALNKVGSLEALIAMPAAPQGVPADDLAAEAAAWRIKHPKVLAAWVERMVQASDKALHELAAARDWMRSAEWGVWRDLPDKLGWGDINARQRRWHEIVGQRERGEASEIKWESLVPELSDPRGGCVATALTDGGMLWDEGKAMHHCVSSYAPVCQDGASRIFSVAKDGARLATLELSFVKASGRWEVAQFLGPCNAAVKDEGALALADRVARAYTEADFERRQAFNAKADKEVEALLASSDLGSTLSQWRGNRGAAEPQGEAAVPAGAAGDLGEGAPDVSLWRDARHAGPAKVEAAGQARVEGPPAI